MEGLLHQAAVDNFTKIGDKSGLILNTTTGVLSGSVAFLGSRHSVSLATYQAAIKILETVPSEIGWGSQKEVNHQHLAMLGY